MNSSLKEKTGFSYIEIIVTFCLIGLIAIFAIPIFQVPWRSISLLSLALQSACDLRWVQQVTLASHLKHEVHFDYSSEEGKYGYFIKKEDLLGEEQTIKKVFLPSKFSLATNLPGNSVWFNANGNPSHTGSITFYDPKNKKRKVYISNIGRIRVGEVEM